LVEHFSKPGDTVLDPFLDGGTSAVVALKAGRKFIGIDIDENAIATTHARIADYERSRGTKAIDSKEPLGRSTQIGQSAVVAI
jgi:DNA modification methylase